MNLIRLIIVLFSTSFFIACDDGGAERASKQKKKEGHWEKPLTDPDPVEEEEKLEAEAESDVFEEETEEEDPSNAELNNKVKIAPKSQDVPEEAGEQHRWGFRSQNLQQCLWSGVCAPSRRL